MKSFKQNLDEQTFDDFISLSEEDFDKFLDTLSEEELNELEEGILGGIAKGVAAVGKGAVKLAKKAVVNKQGNVRVSTAGRADAAQAKLAKIKKKKADTARLQKAKSDISKAKTEAVEYPHMMYDPKTGKGYEAKNKEDHDKMDKMGYTHDKPEVKESKNIVDEITAIMEDGYSQEPTADGSDLSMSDIKNPDTLQQLNALVGAIGIREYMNPKGALLQLQGKLSSIGITFDIPAMTEQSGTATAPLTQYGGITGKGIDTAIDALDNENPAEGLSLQIEYETLKTGLTKVYAKIV